MRKSAHLKNSKSDVDLEMRDAKERSPFLFLLGSCLYAILNLRIIGLYL